MTSKKWFLLWFFLTFAFVVTANIVALLTYFSARIYLLITQDIPIDVYLPGFMKLIKGTSFGGFIFGCGCWWIYYQGYKKNRNR